MMPTTPKNPSNWKELRRRNQSVVTDSCALWRDSSSNRSPSRKNLITQNKMSRTINSTYLMVCSLVTKVSLLGSLRLIRLVLRMPREGWVWDIRYWGINIRLLLESSRSSDGKITTTQTSWTGLITTSYAQDIWTRI